jgi:hypothetical protein
VKENRIVLPIPPGTHWSDAKPLVVPGLPRQEEKPALPSGEKKRGKGAPAPRKRLTNAGGLWFAPRQSAAASHEKPKRQKPQKQRNDPQYIAMARELRDKFLEQVNSGLFLPAGGAKGKYEVSRQLEAPKASPPQLLNAA